MNDEPETDQDKLAAAVSSAFDDLPILARLQFVRNIILDRGGSRGIDPQDFVLITAADVLTGAIKVLTKHPIAAQLSTPECD